MRFKEYKDGGKTSGDKKVYAYNYYLKKGVPAIQAAGIVGNLAAESAFNTTVVGKADSKGSQGIAQWHSERLNGLKKFAGNNWTNLDSQLDYVLHELNTTEKKAKNSLFAAKTPQEASLAFMNDYERPAEWAKRESGSRRINESLKLLGLKPDPNYSYRSEEENSPYIFSEYKKTDYYAPQVSENISSLDNTQETTILAEDKATEIKNRLEQKKAEKALLQQMILATQVAYVNPADYQSQPTFEEPQEFKNGGEKNSLWKNIRANRGSGKKPTKEMLEQERKIKQKEDGGVIEDNRGQWAHPGKITKISSGNITMEGVSYPVYGVDNLGNSQMMYPGQNYQFPGTSVIEYPQNSMFQKGGNIPWYQDGAIFKKQWGSKPETLFESLNNSQTSLNEQALKLGIPEGQGVYSGEGDNKTYISPDNILKEVTITPRKKVIQKEYKTTLPLEYQERNEVVTDNIPEYKIDFSKDKNFDIKGLEKQLESTNKKREYTNIIEEKKLSKELQSQLLQMKGRRNDLDVVPEEIKKIENRDLLSEGSILQAQQKLKKLGYNLNPEGKFKNEGIDGKLGSVTKQAIEQYNNNEILLEQYKSFKDKKGFLGKCVEGQCSEYVQNEVFRNYKPNVSRKDWAEQTGLYGDAWDIGNNIISAGGSEIKTDKVKAGDSVTMYTGGLSTYMNEAKKAGTDATHVGVVDKVNADGSYYILHNVHKVDPLSKVMSKLDPKHKSKYVGMEYRELVKDGRIQNGQNNSGFEIRNAYRPDYKNIKSISKPNTLRTDTSLIPTKSISPEIREASKDFINTINNQDNKKIIATKYGISENDYQSIAQATLGIIYQETKFGTSIKQLPKQIGATLAKAVGYKKDEVSKGAGQVKYKTNFGDTDITEFGITEDNFTEDKNTPLVIMSIVTPYYKNFIKAGETKENALYKAIEKYNRGSNTKYSKNLDVDYVNKVIEQGRNFEVQGKDKKLFNTTLHNLSSNKNLIANNEKRKERELKK